MPTLIATPYLISWITFYLILDKLLELHWYKLRLLRVLLTDNFSIHITVGIITKTDPFRGNLRCSFLSEEGKVPFGGK